jgi:Uma2 family endonuclease
VYTEEAAMSAIPTQPMSTVAELLHHLGVPARRVLLEPRPGQATEKDLVRCERLVELVDGVLVEKPMGYYESRLALVLMIFVEEYLREHDLGITVGEKGHMRVKRNQVRVPDGAFYSWRHFPDRKLPRGQILNIVPDLAVEVLSPDNTRREMKRKRREYFAGGAQLVWQVNPKKRQVAVYTAPKVFTLVEENQTLKGEPVLPGFRLKIRDWFARAGERA